MKRSRSGTAPRDNGPRTQTIILMVALAVVLAFAGSAIFGLRRSGVDEQIDARPVAPESGAPPVRVARGRLEVLNGSGQSGQARLVTERLRAAGFDVVQFGNARSSSPVSTVLDRVGNPQIATDAASVLGITAIRTVLDTTRYVDATVLLGKDWKLRQERQPLDDRDLKQKLLGR